MGQLGHTSPVTTENLCITIMNYDLVNCLSCFTLLPVVNPLYILMGSGELFIDASSYL